MQDLSAQLQTLLSEQLIMLGHFPRVCVERSSNRNCLQKVRAIAAKQSYGFSRLGEAGGKWIQCSIRKKGLLRVSRSWWGKRPWVYQEPCENAYAERL